MSTLRALVPAAALLALLLTPASVEGQLPLPDGTRFSAGIQAGGLTPVTDFPDATRVLTGATAGGTVGMWWTPSVGVRGNLLWARTSTRPASLEAPLVRERPHLFQYGADVIVRIPGVGSERADWGAYAIAGLGAKTWAWEENEDASTGLAGNVGLGLEARPTATDRWGLQFELRNFMSQFDDFGMDDTFHDLVWTLGTVFYF